MWSKMKALESKYIDLANYYKQELVASKQGDRRTSEASSQSNKSAVGGVVPSQQYSANGGF